MIVVDGRRVLFATVGISRRCHDRLTGTRLLLCRGVFGWSSAHSAMSSAERRERRWFTQRGFVRDWRQCGLAQARGVGIEIHVAACYVILEREHSQVIEEQAFIKMALRTGFSTITTTVLASNDISSYISF